MALKRFQLRIMMNRRIRREDALLLFLFPEVVTLIYLLIFAEFSQLWNKLTQQYRKFTNQIYSCHALFKWIPETRHTWDVPATVNLNSSHHLTSEVNEWTISKANLCPLPVACKLNKLHRTTVARKPYGQWLYHQHHCKQETLLINKRVLSSLN